MLGVRPWKIRPSDGALHCSRSPSSTRTRCPLQPKQAVRRRCHGWRRIGYINPPRVVPDPAHGCSCQSVCSYHERTGTDLKSASLPIMSTHTFRKIARLVARHAKDEGANATAVDGLSWMRKARARDSMQSGGGRIDAANRKLLTLAVVSAIIVITGLLGIALVTPCDEDCEANWSSVYVP
jgi:hypothetical protein